MIEYIKLFWEGAPDGEPAVILYEVCLLYTSSQMMGLCPECAHILYGYPNCDHHFQDGRCVNLSLIHI